MTPETRYYLEQTPTTFPTPSPSYVLGKDWFLLTTFYLHLIWAQQVYYPDSVLIDSTMETIAKVYAELLSPEADSFVVAIRTSIYHQFIGGPEQLNSLKFTVIIQVLTYSTNFTTADIILSNILNGNVARMSLPILLNSSFPDLQNVKFTGGSTNASLTPPDPLPAPNDSYKWIIISLFLFVAIALTALLCWKRPSLRKKFLSGLLQMRNVFQSPFYTSHSRKYRFRRLQRSVSEEADDVAIFNRAGLEMEAEQT